MGRHAQLEQDLDLLLGDLCVDLGFCNRLFGIDLVGEGQILTADAFTKAILVAEGMNPEHEIEWFRKIRNQFYDRYGESVSNATYELH